MKAHSTVVGVINGSSFRAFGKATWNEFAGCSDGFLTFEDKLVQATPMMCSSWKCKNHTGWAPMPDGSPNPLARILDRGHRIVMKTTVTYPEYGGEIECTANISRPNSSIQVVEQTRLGVYLGPTNIVEQRGYQQLVTLTQPGRAESEYSRCIVTAEGEIIQVHYDEMIELPYDAEFEPFVINYNVLASSFDGKTFRLQMKPTANWINAEALESSSRFEEALPV